jgi:F/Y rich C-terminus
MQVSVEANPSEVFAHVDPKRCWDLVVQKVNGINKTFYQDNKRRATRTNPFHVQKLGSIDGLEMFGLSEWTVLRVRNFYLPIKNFVRATTYFFYSYLLFIVFVVISIRR